ncbi:50S ribosomal protein L21 [Candidatus Fokinia solitaria]|uniref:Large ribosomal subunit protein bL21 n=1 Tax=Candidatus Fokinia solitaria TaxID=1802984 RepID=A0A2U8BR73_9RICK|nr:50S ribosomal protein L21 [Candidatus Fokinia solitaria]AWD32834.1 50S ribosomal protein L21 [Candidatus Fokinia solitaria]
MFAVISEGAKQYLVSLGSVIKIERVNQNVGEKFECSNVIICSDGNESSMRKGKVVCEVTEHAKDDKILIFKKRRRHTYRRLRGHRQCVSFVKVVDIVLH